MDKGCGDRRNNRRTWNGRLVRMGRRVGWGTKSASEACPEVLETWKASCTGVGPLQGLADLKGSCPVWMEFTGIKKKGHFSIFGSVLHT